MTTNTVVLSIEGIRKLYPGVVALDNCTINFLKGEVHAIVGENGAGKSTLIKIIAGAISSDKGLLRFGEKAYEKMTPALSHDLGIEVIYQEYNLINTLSAAENICLGEKTGKFVNYREMNRKAQEVFDRFGINIDPSEQVENLSSAQMQIVEIAKAVSRKASVLIMDEPTAPLTVSDVKILMGIIKQLKSQGVCIIYISHRLEEIFEIADRVSVLRDGRYITTLKVSETNRAELISHMVGRELTESYPKRTHKLGDDVLEIKNVSNLINTDISLKLKKGEILGISGLVGSGRTELLRSIFGADPITEGEIIINGKTVEIKSPHNAINHGIGLIPEDRKRHGCLLDMSIEWNTSIMNIKNLSKFSVVNRKDEKALAENYRSLLKIKTPDLLHKVTNLSGGNQQKVVLAKTLASNCEIILFDEPTRGIDVGAKQEIYLLMNRLAESGKSIIMVSSDMPELLGMADRIIVLCEGKYAGELMREDFSQTHILDLASGGNNKTKNNIEGSAGI